MWVHTERLSASVFIHASILCTNIHVYAYVYTYIHTHVHVPDVTFAAMPAEARANAVREAWRIVVFHKLEQSPFDAICRDSLALECVCVCVCVCEREREREREYIKQV